MHWTSDLKGGFTTGTPWVPLAPFVSSINVATEAGDPASLLSRYRQLVRLRAGSPVLRRGGTTVLDAGAPQVLATLRELAGDRAVVVHNVGTSAITTVVTAPAGSPSPLLVDTGVTLKADGTSWTVSLPPLSSAVWRVTPGPGLRWE